MSLRSRPHPPSAPSPAHGRRAVFGTQGPSAHWRDDPSTPDLFIRGAPARTLCTPTPVPSPGARHRTPHAAHHLDQGTRQDLRLGLPGTQRSEEHTSELQSLMRISYADFCLKKTTGMSTFNKNTNTNK